MRINGVVLLLIGALASIGVEAQAPTRSPRDTTRRVSFQGWLVTQIRLVDSTFRLAGAVRGNGAPVAGERLVKLTLGDHRETVLWNCGGCWSPTRVSATSIAVLRADGIWIASLTDTNHVRAVHASGLDAIILPDAQNAQRLFVVARPPPRDSCDGVLHVADLSSGTLQPAPAGVSSCVHRFIRADQVRHGQLLTSSQPSNNAGTARRVLVGKGDGSAATELTPDLDAVSTDIDRVDPIWWDDTTILYVTVQR